MGKINRKKNAFNLPRKRKQELEKRKNLKRNHELIL